VTLQKWGSSGLLQGPVHQITAVAPKRMTDEYHNRCCSSIRPNHSEDHPGTSPAMRVSVTKLTRMATAESARLSRA
jgi:hypothetical protein